MKCFLFVLTFLPALLFATPEKDLETKLAGIETMQASFKQVLKDGEGTVLQKSTGSMALKRPGQFRWQIQKPLEQLLVVDGKKTWFYDIALEQVTVQPFKKSAEYTPAELLLSEKNDISGQYLVARLQRKGRLEWFGLKPKDAQSAFVWLRLGFAGNSLAQLVMQDNLGQITQIVFTKTRLNQSIPKQRFNFEAPKGIDVIEI